MTLYSINYDLRNPGRDYRPLHDAIKSYVYWAHPLESMWVIETQKTAAQIRDHLLAYIDSNDGLVVAGPLAEAAWYGLAKDVSEWLKHRLEAAPAYR